MKSWAFAVLVAVGATILGGTLLREPIAYAAQNVGATIVGPLDGDGNVQVHEQGTANVNVTNGAVPVHEQGTTAVRSANEEITLQGLAHEDGPSCGNDIYTVPAGKELVIEYASAFTFDAFETATHASGHLEVFRSSGSSDLSLLFQKVSGSNWAASEAIHYALKAGESLAFSGEVINPAHPGCNMEVDVGGYLQPSS